MIWTAGKDKKRPTCVPSWVQGQENDRLALTKGQAHAVPQAGNLLCWSSEHQGRAQGPRLTPWPCSGAHSALGRLSGLIVPSGRP